MSANNNQDISIGDFLEFSMMKIFHLSAALFFSFDRPLIDKWLIKEHLSDKESIDEELIVTSFISMITGKTAFSTSGKHFLSCFSSIHQSKFDQKNPNQVLILDQHKNNYIKHVLGKLHRICLLSETNGNFLNLLTRMRWGFPIDVIGMCDGFEINLIWTFDIRARNFWFKHITNMSFPDLRCFSQYMKERHLFDERCEMVFGNFKNYDEVIFDFLFESICLCFFGKKLDRSLYDAVITLIKNDSKNFLKELNKAKYFNPPQKM